MNIKQAIGWTVLGACFGTAAAFATGCGAPEDVEQTEPEYAAESDIGELEQALSTVDGYGTMADMNRCWTAGGTIQYTGPDHQCNVPNSRTQRIAVPNFAGGASGGCDATFAQAAQQAATLVANQMNAHGWNVVRQANTQRPPTPTITMTCGAPFAGTSSGAKGSTQLTTLTTPECFNRAAGKICKYTQAQTRLFTSRLVGTAEWNTATQAQRVTYLQFLFMHELGHAFGLGHDTCAETPLMCSPNPATYGSPLRDFTSFEYSAMQSYSP